MLWQQFLMIIKLLGVFLQQILQVEILLGDQFQDMLARDLKRFNGGSGPVEQQQ
jgi:hypothetical protein